MTEESSKLRTADKPFGYVSPTRQNFADTDTHDAESLVALGWSPVYIAPVHPQDETARLKADIAELRRICTARIEELEARTSVEPLLQQVGDSIADVFEQMLKGKWQDDHGHAVFNNIKMDALKTSLKAIAKFRADHLGYPATPTEAA